jgi:hypothetical protein
LAATGAAGSGAGFVAAATDLLVTALAALPLTAGAALALVVDIELYRYVTGQLCVPPYQSMARPTQSLAGSPSSMSGAGL